MKNIIAKKIEIIKNKMRTLGLKSQIKNTIVTASIAASGLASTFPGNANPNTNPRNDETSSEPDNNHIEAMSSLPIEVKSSGVYKNIEINFEDCTPHHLAWVFEAGMKPGIVDSKNSYIGLFQMDLGATAGRFLKEYKDKYPHLSEIGKTKSQRTIRNGEFQKSWKKEEQNNKEFLEDLCVFMDTHKYAPIFEELRKNGLDVEERGPVVAGMIMSAANQYRPSTVIEMVKDSYQAAETKTPENQEISTIDLIASFYDRRVQETPRMRTRIYGTTQGGKKIAGEKQMAMDWQKYYVETEQVNLSSRKQMESLFMVPLDTWLDTNILKVESDAVKNIGEEKIPNLVEISPKAKSIKSKKPIKTTEMAKRLGMRKGSRG